MNLGVLVQRVEGQCGYRRRPQLPLLVPPDSPLSCWDDIYFESDPPFRSSAARLFCFNTFLPTVFPRVPCGWLLSGVLGLRNHPGAKRRGILTELPPLPIG